MVVQLRWVNDKAMTNLCRLGEPTRLEIRKAFASQESGRGNAQTISRTITSCSKARRTRYRPITTHDERRCPLQRFIVPPQTP
jgi:hypothetical protein